ncbi:putative ABC transporter ATP-binding protein YbiT [anaerobic digester metagenome]
MLTAHKISYQHPNRDTLFQNISLSVLSHSRIALIGNNGTGKSTLLKILAGTLFPSSGEIVCSSQPYYIPQHIGLLSGISVAKALGVEAKVEALQHILKGNALDSHFSTLNDDWNIEERCMNALLHWKLPIPNLHYPMEKLSGGEKTKVFLAGIAVHSPEIVLLDEPTNHLDFKSRELLYDFITTSNHSFIVVSHDRTLLELLNPICELRPDGITTYGGNYTFYQEQKAIEANAITNRLEEQEKALRKAKRVEREALERKQRQDSRGKKQQVKEGTARILMNTLRNNAETSSAKLKNTHAEKISSISAELSETRKNVPLSSKMKIDSDSSTLHNGKLLVRANDINYTYNSTPLWAKELDFQILSGERIHIKGENGAGKTTLIKLICGTLEPSVGSIFRTPVTITYIDQEYSIISNNATVYEQAQQYNHNNIEEHEVKIRLNRYLFGKDTWDKPCHTLSGGEKMRLTLCCLLIANNTPDMFILDEPTNNLDIQNIEILTTAINHFKGTLLVISHDNHFIADVGLNKTIELKRANYQNTPTL